ncbi:hypothetical protein Trydic_g12387 [Trypoxylus dichotomus]
MSTATELVPFLAAYANTGGTITESGFGGKAPWLISLWWKHPETIWQLSVWMDLRSSSTVIRLIMTVTLSAHRETASKVTAVVGTDMQDFEGSAVRVHVVVLHPSFSDMGVRPKDIAMIRLASALIYSTLTTQSLIDQEIDRAARFRILGGTIAENGAYPFMASLRLLPNAHFCGGTIINSLWVLTAAHCMFGKTISRIKVVVGTNLLDSGGVATRIQRVVTHPNFMNTGVRPNDIALIRLAYALTYSNTIAAASIELEDPVSTTDVTVIGWGATRRNGTSSNRLRRLSTTTITPVACKRYWPTVTANQICTKLERGKGPEDGDSGGPLIDTSTKILLGVASFISFSGTRPDVYTRISEYMPWIEDTINPQN